jgi:hypothetical protein
MSGLDCRRYEGALIEFARGGETDADTARHLESCLACHTRLNQQRRLSKAVKHLAGNAALFTPPDSIGEAIRVELESRRAVRPIRRRVVQSALIGAIAASLAIVWFVKSRPAPQVPVAHVLDVTPASEKATLTTETRNWVEATEIHAAAQIVPAKKKVQPQAAAPEPQAEQPFIAIPYTPQIEPYERAEVMRVNVPVAALIAAGLPMSTVDPTAKAQADVLVGQDGRARAVRLIAISTLN